MTARAGSPRAASPRAARRPRSVAPLAARAGYALLFVAALPAALAAWARRLDALLALPSPRAPLLGWATAGAGAALMLAAMRALWVHGHGLPASPFPPRRLVARGPYRLLAHPIYVGAVAVAAGVSIAEGSGAGLWIVSPLLALSAAAWVLGVERSATRARFGPRPAPLLALPAIRAGPLWAPLRHGAERVANSWREWTLGPVRLIVHGAYAAVGAVAGLVAASALAGPGSLAWLVAATLAAVVAAGLWAQAVEGSPALLRPYGYFGAFPGVALVALVAAAAGRDAWRLVGAFAVGSTLTYAFGRLRCLVQGCCHGREAPAAVGIRYTHPRSRVVRLAGLGGVPLHPTPLYSLLAMLAVGAACLTLWLVAAPLSLVAGAYLVLAGLARFVEEHYRGEPQTAVVGGLRLYQWLAVALVVGGAALTAVRTAPAPPPAAVSPRALLALLPVGLVVLALYGVDFPRSRRRFSRLV